MPNSLLLVSNVGFVVPSSMNGLYTMKIWANSEYLNIPLLVSNFKILKYFTVRLLGLCPTFCKFPVFKASINFYFNSRLRTWVQAKNGQVLCSQRRERSSSRQMQITWHTIFAIILCDTRVGWSLPRFWMRYNNFISVWCISIRFLQSNEAGQI